MTIFILFLGLILLPITSWEVSKVWFYLRFIEVFFIFSVFDLIKNKITIPSKNKNIIIVLFIFLLVAVTSSLIGSDLSKSFFGNYYRGDGLISLFHLAAFGILIGSVYKKKWNTTVAIGIFLGSVLSSIFNNFGQDNFLAGFILISIPLGIYLFKKTNNKHLKVLIVLGFIIQVYRMFLTYSYIGIFGLVILYPLWKLTDKKRFSKIWFFIIISTFLVIFSLWLNNLISKKEYVAESRIRIYRNVFLGTLKSPILGYGWANADYAFESITWPLKFNNDVYVDKAHGLFLEVFATTGVLGIILFVTFLILLLKKLINKNDLWSRILLTSLLLYLIYSQTNVTSISYEFLFWLLVGITLKLI